jgi:hypothetical protein
MANSIATLSVRLTANISSFSASMAAATKPLAGFASSVAGATTKIVGLAGAGAALVAGGSLVYLTKQSLNAIDTIAKLADRLGLTTEGLIGLQYAGDLAGVSSDQLTGALEKMLKSLGGAADDGELASNAFTKLGLNAEALANSPADEAFSTIAQKISEIENPAERATAAMAIFGKSGQSLLPLMMSGADGIKAAQQEAEKLGLTYSRVDAAKVEQANDAITRMTKIFEGVTNQLAIGLAPYIDAAATKFTELATSGGGIGPMVGGAIEWVAKAIATAADYAQLLPMAFYGFRAGALQAIAGVLGGIDTLGSGLVKLMNLLPGVNVEWTDTFSTLQQGMEQVAAEEAAKFDKALGAFQRGDNAAAVTKVFDDIKAKSAQAAQATADNAKKMSGAFNDIEDNAKALQKVADTLKDLQKDVSQFGLSDAAKKVTDLAAGGATAEQIGQAKELLAVKQQLDAATKIDTGDPLADFSTKTDALLDLYNAGKIGLDQLKALGESAKSTLNDKLADQAKSVVESVKTPMEAYTEEMQKLQTLLDRNLITRDVFDRAAKAAMAKIKDPAEAAATETVAPSIVQAGSAEAQRFAFDQSRGAQRMGKDELSKQALAEAKESSRLLDRIERNTRTAGAEVETVTI